jgi:hypothetical protein
MLSRDHFQLILEYFHTIHNRNLVEHVNGIFRYHLTPYQQLSVEEGLVGTKNHIQMLQYLPKKHHHHHRIKTYRR